MEIVNSAAYQFLPLANLHDLREKLLAKGEALGVKGTIILSPEGVNCAVAATQAAMTEFKQVLAEDFQLPFKDSYSAALPFVRYFVKLKPEIITFRQPTIKPGADQAPYISPKKLQKWLQAGKDVVLLDTRNRFELDYGKFSAAVDLGINNFTEFADAVSQLPPSYKEATVVTYCTGGVRCEKAAPFLKEQGYQNVYQIEGGILNYFSECGAEHYTGDCFVFDERVALTPELTPSEKVLR